MNGTSRLLIAGAVYTALCGHAHALTRAEYATAVKIYFSGSMSTDNALETAFIGSVVSICDTSLGSIDVYRAANQRVITCKVSKENTPVHSFPSRAYGGTPIAFHKESRGGSSNGVIPLIAVANGQAHSLRWLDVSQLLTDCTVVSMAATATTAAYIEHSNCPLLLTPSDTAESATYDVHGGISDVEPALSYPAPTAANIARLSVYPGIAVVFGVPVSLNLYRALQHVQFNGACDAGAVNDTTACVPSLTRPQLSSLYSQNIITWGASIKDAEGNSLNSAAALDGVVPVPLSGRVKICRRVATSGTQAAFESYFLHQRCLADAPSIAGPDDGSTTTDTTWVPANFSSTEHVNVGVTPGNVRSCLAQAQSQNFWAIGMLSMEVTDSEYNSGNAGFRFIGIDGAAPNLTNVANGTYSFFTENTVNRIVHGHPGGLTDNVDLRHEVFEAVDYQLSSLGTLIVLNDQYVGRPWGNGGVLALTSTLTTATAPYSDEEVRSQPVNTLTRNRNNCSVPRQSKSQPVFGIE